MRNWLPAAVSLASAACGIAFAVDVISIYAFDYFEPAWGRGGSLQVGLWISISTGLVSLLGASLGFRSGSHRGPVPKPAVAALLSIIVLVLTLAITYPLSFVLDAGRPIAAVLVLFSLAVGVSYLACRPPAVLPNTSLERTRAR